jgi:hypothetical protein
VLLLLCCLLAVPALAATYPHISFHSTLLGDDGKPLRGLQIVTFYVHDSADRRGDALWIETIPIEVRENGEYFAELGAASPRFGERVINGHALLYVSVRTSNSSQPSPAAVVVTIPQGIWVDCNPDNSAGNCDGISGLTSEAELQTIAAAKFGYVFNDSNLWGTQSEIASWADQASSSSLKIIWYIPLDFALYQSTSISNYSLIGNDTELASSFCSGCTNSAFTTALVQWFATFSATAGYYLDDEYVNMASQGEIQNYKGRTISESAIEADIATLYSTVRAADPNHSIYGAETWDSVNTANESQLAGFLDPIEADLNVMGADYYPVGTGEAASTEASAASWLDTIAGNYNKSTFMNLQAFSWEDFAPGCLCFEVDLRLPHRQPVADHADRCGRCQQSSIGPCLVRLRGYGCQRSMEQPRLRCQPTVTPSAGIAVEDRHPRFSQLQGGLALSSLSKPRGEGWVPPSRAWTINPLIVNLVSEAFTFSRLQL